MRSLQRARGLVLAAAAGALVLVAVAGALVLAPAAASAHEAQHVGDLEMIVGFGSEPAYTGQPNSVQLILVHGGEPVVDLGGSLSVEVSFGDVSQEMSFEPFFEVGEFGEPGDYRAWFVPSQPGKYSFHITGTVEGEKVDEEFTSGPKTFSEVENLTSAAFPEVTAPSNDELATRIESETARSGEAITAANAAAASADDAAESARTVGLVGVVLGALGVIAAIGALAASRRR